MKDRIDPLILERAPWLRRSGPHVQAARAVMDAALGYRRCIALAQQMEPLPAERIMDRMGGRIARRVEAVGLEHIPRTGAAFIVANHPTGIADGIILHHLLSRRRPDLYFFANSDILRILPQMSSMICPVEWREEKRSRAGARETMLYTRRAVEDGRLGVIFPSGRLMKRRGLTLHERPWMASAASLARKFDIPLIPMHITARNSALFYLLDAIHPTLRDVTLFHETLNKDHQRFRVRIGAPVAQSELSGDPHRDIETMKQRVLSLAVPARRTRSGRERWLPDSESASFPLTPASPEATRA